MSFQSYLISQYEHTHENLFFRDIVKLMEVGFTSTPGEHILIGNITVEGHPLDAIFIKNGLLTVIDFKDYSGALTFSENNAWRIVTEDNEMSFVKGGGRFLNPFQQVKAYRFALTEFLANRKDRILEKNHTNINWNFIGGIVLFHEIVKFEKKSIPGIAKRYFHILYPETLIPFIHDSFTDATAFSDVEIHRILEVLNITNENKYSSNINFIDEGPKPNIKIPQSRLKLLTSVLEGNENDSEIKKVLKFYRTLIKLESHLDSSISDETSYVFKNNDEKGLGIDITSVESFYNKYLTNRQQNFPKNIFVGVKILISGNRYPLFYTIVFNHEIKSPESLRISYADLELNRKILENLGLDETVIDELSSKLSQKESLQEKVDVLNDYLGGVNLVTDSISIGFSNENLFTSQVLSEIKKCIEIEGKIEAHTLFKSFLLNKTVDELSVQFEFDPFIQVTKLNPSQRRAVDLSFKNPITVVTGPPGTGKTQVVLNIIANAIVNNQTILFASKNNKAVDNVIERFHSLCNDEYLLRFGSKRDVSENTKVVIESMLNNKTNNQYKDDPENVVRKKEQISKKQKQLLEIEDRLSLIPRYKIELEELEEQIKNKIEILVLLEKVNDFKTLLEPQVNDFPDVDILYDDQIRLSSVFKSSHKTDISISTIIKKSGELKKVVEHSNIRNQELKMNYQNVQNELTNWILEMNPDLRFLFIDNKTLFNVDLNEAAKSINKITRAKKGFFYGIVFNLFVKNAVFKKSKDWNEHLPDLGRTILNQSTPLIKPDIDLKESLLGFLTQLYSLTKESNAIPLELKRKENLINLANEAIFKNKSEIEGAFLSFNSVLEKIKIGDRKRLDELKFAKDSYRKTLNEILEQEEELKRNHREIHESLLNLGIELMTSTVRNKLFNMQPDRVQRYLNFIPAVVWKNEELQEFDISCQDFIKDFKAVSVTSLSVKNGFSLSPRLFDILVIDEASQCDVASALPLLFRAKKVVIIGDSMQLKHITAVREYEEKYLAELLKIGQLGLSYVNSSLFDFCKNLAHQSKYDTVFLNEHYRCHPEIIRFSDYHFYKKRLGQELDIKTTAEQFKFSPSGLHWLHVNGVMTKGYNANELEAKKCVDLARQLVAKHPNASIGIVTPFRHQYERIFELMDSNLREKVKVDTVHKYQGDEKDIIILSLVLTENSRESLANFINRGAPYLLNVAITRARNSLYIIGNADYCNGLLTQNNTKTLLKHLVEHADALKKIIR